MYNWEPTLPIDVKYSLVYIERNESEQLFNKETFDAVLKTTISARRNIDQTAGKTFVRHKKRNAMIVIDAITCLTRLKWVKKYF